MQYYVLRFKYTVIIAYVYSADIFEKQTFKISLWTLAKLLSCFRCRLAFQSLPFIG